MASTEMLHNTFLVPTWVLHGPSTFQRTLSRSHTCIQGTWGCKTLWRMCRRCTQTLFCYLYHSFHVRKLLLDFKQTFPSWHLYTASPHLVTLFALLSLYCSLFFLSLPIPLEDVPQHKRETTLTRKTRVGSCSPFCCAPLLFLAFLEATCLIYYSPICHSLDISIFLVTPVFSSPLLIPQIASHTLLLTLSVTFPFSLAICFSFHRPFLLFPFTFFLPPSSGGKVRLRLNCRGLRGCSMLPVFYSMNSIF